jgi:exopolyphosphatase/guanosine-5'-triphosphate,3'-diphosphate pyrophosphatase
MRCACIDIGSNTTRLLAAEPGPGGLTEVVQLRAFTRIGRSLDALDAIPEATIDAVVKVVGEQRAAARDHGCTRIRVVATAAIRRAANGAELVRALRERAGVEAEILSGEEEARLAFHGAARTLDPPPDGTLAVVDVGGGSTEIAVGTLADGVLWSQSFPVGSSSLHAACVADPPSEIDLARMRVRARAAFDGAVIPEAADAVAVGGSAASLPLIVGPVLDGPALERALGVLAGATAREVARLHGLAHERTQLLPAGILVLDAAAQALGGRPLRIGRGGLREGVVLELAAS